MGKRFGTSCPEVIIQVKIFRCIADFDSFGVVHSPFPVVICNGIVFNIPVQSFIILHTQGRKHLAEVMLMINDNVIQELWEREDGQCAHCGTPLVRESIVIDHIFPQSHGGADHIDNLRLLCRDCNSKLSNHTHFSEHAFKEYLQHFLAQDPRFENVCEDMEIETPNGQKMILDLTFTRNHHGIEEMFAVEVKEMSAATDRRITSAIQQVAYYKKACPNVHFILAVPTLLAADYCHRIEDSGITLWDSKTLRLGIPDTVLPTCTAPDQYDELIAKLNRCQPGYENWQVYQRLVGEILSAVFCPPLDSISEQNPDANYANRRDFILPNYAEHGYWMYLRERYRAEFIVVDAKNSAREIGKDDILQVAHYLKEKGVGLFGLIFSRYGGDESSEIHLRDIWQSENKMIVVLRDNDVEQMLLSKQRGNDPSRIIIEKIQEFRQRI